MAEARSSFVGVSSASRAPSSFEKLGDRTRFTVELRTGETTIVSWKKLVKDASKASGSAPASAVVAPAPAMETSISSVAPALESRLAPGQPPNELKDAAEPNRFNAVIEKIERLYKGKDSSDEEDLGDVPDDDQYDTEDSFIDDAELDEYFEVDKSKTKHDGFFINRGKLESIEPSLPPTQQLKKRRRKEVVMGESDDGQPIKHLKVRRKGSGKTASSAQNSSLPTSLSPGTNPQKIADGNKLTLGGMVSVRNEDATKVLSHKLKETVEFSDSAHMRYYERSGTTHGQVLETSFQQRENSGNREQIDLNVAASALPIQNVKSSLCYRREGSNTKPKGNKLDRAIRELEKFVAESRPHVGDFQDADATYQATKRRLPQEIKHKLAKVARVVVSNGMISTDLLNRLMGILGHLINLRTLKRNFKIMISESLSVNQEKDGKFQQTKKEVIELIKAHGSSLISKAIEQQPGSADDFQESRLEDKVAVKVRYAMDPVLEDKICDLYDIYVDGLDDDVGRQARKLYAELAELWPKGTMDNHGIKRAICHAKERRRILHDRNKDQERLKPKKLMTPKVEERSQVDSTASQPQHTEGDTIFGNITPNNTTASPTTMTVSFSNSPVNPLQDYNLSMHEKMKADATHSHAEFRKPDGITVKKKVKRKPEANSSEERQKSHKQQTTSVAPVNDAPLESSLQLSAPQSYEQLT